MAINKANAHGLDHKTAKVLMYLVVEGVHVWATDAQWRRIHKRAAKLGLRIPDQHNIVTVSYLTEIHELIFKCDLMDEVDSFLEDMYIMGMLDEDYPEDDDYDEEEGE